MSVLDDQSIAVAHWHINAWGGAEYLVTKLAEAVDVDCVYTIGPPDPTTPNPYGDVNWIDVTSTLSYRPVRNLQRRFGRLSEYAIWEDVDWREFGDFDVVLSSGSTSRALITPDDTLHVNYCHSPPRWFYDLYHDRKDTFVGSLARPLVRYLRTRDMTIDPRVDYYLVNSPIIERRLWKYYKRDSDVLYPPVDLDRYRNSGDGGFYLHLGRLDEEKGISEVVRAFETLGRQLVLAGGKGDVQDETVRRINRLENVEYRGFVSEGEKLELLATCRALVFNGRNEDFGIVPIETNASGKACLAPDDGFPAIFVDDGKNGLLHDGTRAGIVDAVERFERDGFTVNKSLVEMFSTETFQKRLETALERWITEFERFEQKR